MKLTIVLTTLAFLQVSASGVSQTVTFSGKNVTLETVFDSFKKQTGYVFFYSGEVTAQPKRISVNLHNQPLEEALTKVLEKQDLSFLIRGNTVFIRKTDQPAGTNEVLAEKPPINITGRVINERNEPVVSASVIIKGTQRGTTTDINGNFALNDVPENAVLVISSIGINTREVNVDGRTSIIINVTTRIEEEEVVIAYGTQKRKEVTGSVSTISSKQLAELNPVTNIEQALQGQAAGVFVLQESGQPGAATRVRIRGSSSLLGSNQPLYVVDGIPVVAEPNIANDGGTADIALRRLGLNSPLNNISPEMIESISVLKDASATAIYGSRAANGVVIITTKRGNSFGEPRYNFTSSFTYQRAQTDKVLNAAQFREIWTEAARNSTSTAAVIQEILNGTYFENADTDWEKELRPADPITFNVGFNVAGGNERIRYFAGINMQDQKGSLANAFFKRYSFLVKLDLEASRHVKLGTSINLSSSTQEAPDNGLLTRLYTFRPDLPVYDANGNYSFSRYNNFENPVAMAQIRNTNKTHLLIGSVFGELNFATNFLLRSTLSINYNIGNFRSYSPGFTSAGGFTRASGNGPGLAQESNNNTLTHLWENTLTYTNRFGQDHSLEAILGASWQGDENRFLKASGKGFPESSILNNLSSATSDFTVGSGSSQSGLISYFGRVNYTFKDRYMLSFSARADGSSKFAEENKWAFFPTVAGAWRISDEDFLEGVNFINELKLRASTGVTGQANFGAYQWRTLYGSTSYGGAPAVIQNQLGNSRLKWELTNQTDIGLDFSLFDYRFSGSLDYYVKNTSDLLYFTNLPGSTGEIRAIGNLGNTQNKGIELTLEGDIIRSNNFNWNLSVNASRNRNKLVSLNEDFTDKSTGIITPPNTGSKLKVGEPLGLIYGYVADGLFRTQEELDALNAAAGTGLYYQAAATRPGDIKFRDLNGDNRVTVADQDIIGNANPDLVGGFTNTFQFKGFSLSALFTYSIGNDLRWGTMATATTFLSTGSENKIALVMDRWTPDNPDATIPRVAYGDPANNGRVSSFYVYDASYLRLKNINLTYTFPQEILSKTRFIRTADIYVNALNLATFTKYPGANPEVSNLYDDDVSTGLDNSRFPISKAFTIGIRLGF